MKKPNWLGQRLCRVISGIAMDIGVPRFWTSSKVAIIAPRDEHILETIQALATHRNRYFFEFLI